MVCSLNISNCKWYSILPFCFLLPIISVEFSVKPLNIHSFPEVPIYNFTNFLQTNSKIFSCVIHRSRNIVSNISCGSKWIPILAPWCPTLAPPFPMFPPILTLISSIPLTLLPDSPFWSLQIALSWQIYFLQLP